MINLKIEKKDLWLLTAIMVFLVAVAYVIAYGGNNPAVHGHDVGEVEGAIETYDSGWFQVNRQSRYTKTHNLGSQSLVFQQFFAPDAGGSPDLSRVTPVVGHNDANVDWRYIILHGIWVYNVTTTQFQIATGYEYVGVIPTSSGNSWGVNYYTSGWSRIIATRVI